MGNPGFRKPWWGWKSRACAELAEFDIPFAVKEYCQNQIGQILKALETREWSRWERRSLAGFALATLQSIKANLETECQSMFTGPHGSALRHADWLPVYILTATIDREQIKNYPRETDLKVCTVIWEHEPTGLWGLSFFNNHMDSYATFSSFVVDGKTTSRSNRWAVGEKGKGFVLATQFFFENVKQTVSAMTSANDSKSLKPGVSFTSGTTLESLNGNEAQRRMAPIESHEGRLDTHRHCWIYS
ncbi:hypothetical protein FRB90_004913 [Tulasnella sp. 427]|nr:hypothetical protein FRB90_004913 [Tulasnella sp. 427]